MGSDFGLSNYPAEWELTTLGELLDLTGGSIQTGPFGSQLHAADYVDDGIPSVMPKNISIEGIVEKDIARITDEDAQRLSKYLILAGDIIYSRRGDVEKCALVKPEEAGWLCGTGCLRVRLGKKSTISPNFLHAYLSAPFSREWISRNAIGATMPNLNTSILRDVPVLVPGKNDISFIADNWRLLNEKINLNRQTNQTLEKMAQALFKSWFVDFDPVIDNALAAGNPIPDELQERAERRQQQLAKPDHKPLPDDILQLFPSEFELTEELGWVPKGWKVNSIGSVIETVGGGTPKTKEDSYWVDGIHAFCTPKDMSNMTSKILLNTGRHLTKAGVEKISSGILPVGTVLMSSRAPIGYLAITDIPVSVNQGIIALKQNEKYGCEYLLCWAEANMEEVISRANGSTFLEISKNNFRDIAFLEAQKDVLSAFSDIAASYFGRFIGLQCEVNQLTKIRDTLLPKLISGELRLPSEALADVGQQPVDATS